MDAFIENHLPFGAGAFRWTVGKGEEFWGVEKYDWMRKQYDSVAGAVEETAKSAADATAAKLAANLISPTSTADPAAAIYYAGRIGLATWAERQTGTPLTYFYTSDQYLLQFTNPQFLPNQLKVDQAFLFGTIDEPTWGVLDEGQRQPTRTRAPGDVGRPEQAGRERHH